MYQNVAHISFQTKVPTVTNTNLCSLIWIRKCFCFVSYLWLFVKQICRCKSIFVLILETMLELKGKIVKDDYNYHTLENKSWCLWQLQ